MPAERDARRRSTFSQVSPAVWAGALAPVLAAGALSTAVLLGARADRAYDDAEIVRRRLEVVEARRDILIAMDRLEAEAWMLLIDGEGQDRMERAAREFNQALRMGRARLEEMRAQAGPGGAVAEQVLRAIQTFEDQEPSTDTAADVIQASSRAFDTIGWVDVTAPEGPWFELSSLVIDLQVAPNYAYDHIDYSLARYAEANEKPPLPPAAEAVLERNLAGLHAEAERTHDHETPAGTLRLLTEVIPQARAEAADAQLGKLFDDLLSRPGVTVMRDSTPFLLGVADTSQISARELYLDMYELAKDLENGAQEAIERADHLVAGAAQAARRRTYLASVAAAGLTLLSAALLVWAEARRRHLNNVLRAAAEVDSLTGLANRYALHRYEPERLARPDLAGFAVLETDLDNFKAINDSFGHQVGDLALVAFAERCRAVVRDADSLARIGGDEFVIVLYKLRDPEIDAAEIAERIRQSLQQPVECAGRQIMLHTSIGIATASAPTQLDDLLVEADLALHEAKERGLQGHQLFATTSRGPLIRRLPGALASANLECVYQPQLNIQSGEVIGLEALVRWPGGDQLVVDTNTLVDAVEWLGETRRLLRCVSNEAGKALRTLGDSFDQRIWMNLSPSDLAAPDAAEQVLQILSRSGVAPDRVGVEITERMPIHDFEHAARGLQALRRAGIRVAIDDFGTGNTPLKHLTSLPLDVVKLDRTIVGDIGVNASHRVVVRAVVDICRHHNLVCLAEGVERAEDIALLDELGVEQVQGFALSAPLDPQHLAEFLAAYGRGTPLVLSPADRRPSRAN